MSSSRFLPRAKREPLSFEGVPELVNKQFQYQTLGEMVVMYKRTGEFPAVGMRNGVYCAKDGLDSDVVPTDKFDLIDLTRRISDEILSEENKLDEAMKNAKKDELATLREQASELQSLKKKMSNISAAE